MRQIARVLIQERRRVLAVQDWHTPERIGIPGGGIERGEKPWDAAQRELREETGLSTVALMELCVLEDTAREQLTFVYAAIASGELRDSHEGRALWVPRAALLRGQYADFHACVFEVADR